MSAEKKFDGRRVRLITPNSSEQDILDSLPAPGELVSRAEQKTSSKIGTAYLVYVVTHFGPSKAPSVTIRKLYESKTDAVEAFIREYTMWTSKKGTGVYPANHTEDELSRKHLINLLDASKVIDSSIEDSYVVAGGIFTGRGKVVFNIVHREDKKLNKEDPKQRKIVIVCEETTFEAM